jgi:hypothetical protein
MQKQRIGVGDGVRRETEVSKYLQGLPSFSHPEIEESSKNMVA